MVGIKKFFIGLSVVVCITILVLYLLILGVSRGYFDKPIKKGIEIYLNYKNAQIKIGNLQIRNNILSIDKIFMDLTHNTKGEITNFNINFVISNLMSNLIVTNIISMDSFTVISEDNQPIIETVISAKHIIEPLKNNTETEINLSPIKSIALLDSYGKYLPDGAGICTYTNKTDTIPQKSLDCKFTFSNQANFLLKGKIHNNIVEAQADINNIPIIIYKIGEKFLADNEIVLFLQQYIKGGYIRTGELNLNFDNNALTPHIPENAINGKLHIIDLEYKYDPDYPALKKVDTDVKVAGSKVDFVVNQAYSSDTLLSGLITLEWKGMEDSYFTVNANAKGEAIDLIDFIPAEDYKKAKSQGIDLKKVTGQANSKIEISIPINPQIKNTYNISTVITNANLTAFDNNIILKNAKMTGSFNGDKIVVAGVGKINNNNSNFVYQHNIISNKKDNYDKILSIKATIPGNNQQFGIIKLLGGSTILDFEYKTQNNGESIISANANLKNLEFYIDKISIHKTRGKEAKLTLLGNLENNLKDGLHFDLVGENNLKITGQVKLPNNKYDITLPVISYGSTNLTGRLLLDKDNLNAEIQGKQLDLSNSNMMQFLEKAADTKNIHLKVGIEKIRLQNNIWLNDFNLQIGCDKTKCFAGSLFAKIGSKTLKMLLTDKQDKEQWFISCNNAGALLKGIGMYNNMKTGTVNLNLETKRQEVKKGEIIPILNGTFNIKQFIITDMSFLTRIVSFVSFPGFMSFILNNKDIMFTNMQGQFSYIGNTVKISNSAAEGPFFDFTMQGVIDTDRRQIKLKGNVIPSFFFMSNIITKIPIIGKIFSKVAPYSIALEYKE